MIIFPKMNKRRRKRVRHIARRLQKHGFEQRQAYRVARRGFYLP